MRFCTSILDATPCAQRLVTAHCAYVNVAWRDVTMRAKYRIDVMCLDDFPATFDVLGERALWRHLLITNAAKIDIVSFGRQCHVFL